MLAHVFALAVPDSQAMPLVPPAVIFVLAVVGALAMMLVLPGRAQSPIRKLGGVVLLATLLILAALLTKRAAGLSAYFWIFSAIALLSAARVITHTKPVYSALYFVLTVMASAGLFVLMNAEFMAAALVLIYAGAILVTYVFVIMLASEASPQTMATTGEDSTGYNLAEHDAISREPIAASAIGFALLGVLLFVIFDKPQGLETPAQQARATVIDDAMQKVIVGENAPSISTQPAAASFVPVGQTQQLGAYLFKTQLVSLELAGVILTVAMVGAIMIARRRIVKFETESYRSGETITAPATPIDDDPHSIPVFGTENPRQKAYPET